MGNMVKRPWSVWIAQVFFVYALLMWVLAFLLALRTTPSDPSFVGILFFAVYSLIYVGLFVIAFWGMAERKPYGRWLGVVLLSFMMIFMNVSKVLLPGPAEGTVGIAMRILLCVLLFIVVLHISMSEKAEAFFIRKVAQPRIDHPPPPPTFDD